MGTLIIRNRSNDNFDCIRAESIESVIARREPSGGFLLKVHTSSGCSRSYINVTFSDGREVNEGEIGCFISGLRDVIHIDCD